MLNLLRASLRLIRLAGHLGRGLLKSARLRRRHGEHWHQSPEGQATIQQWMQGLTRILALRVEVPLEALPVPAMIAANHISWLDVIAIASVRPAQFLAKEEVRRWPLIGPLAARSGTRFIQRNRASALFESNQHLCHALRLRQHVVIFPEGTTSDGRRVDAFHPALFEAARRAYCPIQPLAIRYRRDGAHDDIAPYTGDDLFITHLWRILARPETHVELRFLPPLSSRAHRRELAAECRALIVTELDRKAMPVLDPLPRARPKASLGRETALTQEGA